MTHMRDINQVNRILGEESIAAIAQEAADRFREESKDAPLLGAPELSAAEYDLQFFSSTLSDDDRRWFTFDRGAADRFELDFNDNAFLGELA